MAKEKLVKTSLPFEAFSTEADLDYLLARALDLAGNQFHMRAGYFAHQCCEKYLKALTVQHSSSYIETHNLKNLWNLAKDFYPKIDRPDIGRILSILDAFEQVGRYGAAANFDPYSQKDDRIETAGVACWGSDTLTSLDFVVTQMRNLLDYSKHPGMNALHAILALDHNNLFGKGWNLKPALRQILLRGNDFVSPIEIKPKS